MPAALYAWDEEMAFRNLLDTFQDFVRRSGISCFQWLGYTCAFLRAAGRGMVMVNYDLTLLLIPLVPALAFMLWVFWALEKEIRRNSRHFEAIARARAGTDRPAAASAPPEHRLSVTFAHSHSR